MTAKMKGSRMKKEEQKSLNEINKSLQENIRLLPDECQQQLKPSMEEMEKFTSEHEKMMRALRPLFLIMFILMILFGALFADYAFYSSQLEKTIDNKNDIIRRYQYQDSVYSRLLEQTDTSKYISYRIYKGQPITYQQLARKYDTIQTKYNKLLEEDAEKQTILESIQQLYSYEVKPKNGGFTIYGPDYKEQLRLANAQADSLQRLCNQCQYENYVQKAKLDLVINRYPIFFRQDSNSVFISSPQIDSALMLLPYYRDNLEYDAENKTWSIVTVREKVIISEREVNRKKKR